VEKIYCISGLGADHRFFSRLALSDYELVPVLWTRFEATDSLQSYAMKLAVQIKDDDPLILGLSFGGMLAVEIAKVMKVKKAFLVSSAKGQDELSIPGGGIARWLINSGTVPAGILNVPNPLVLNYLGARTNEEKALLRSVISASNGEFMKWALKAIVNWKNNVRPENIVHLHGTADMVIKSANVHPDHWIENGTHIMIYNRAEEVSRIIGDYLGV
jgi:pimeloyl-ACP methyl ester carboxylesterase